jgi:diaminohydroxyphosphoribosylaminopyrimidine deaminase/5-amino-6-(5-phosphoribosylamino)uracil reductase
MRVPWVTAALDAHRVKIVFKLSPDELMNIALKEAEKCTDKVRPNPRVGAALELLSGEVISGFHPQAGGPHAERVVLEECRIRNLKTQGARMAVTLEPCSHTGKTPPCTEALIQAGIAEVIIPFLDPNPLVRGQGVDCLKKQNVKVFEGTRQSEAFLLNREWLWAQKLQRPFVFLKMATSSNHVWKKKDGDPWITSLAARMHAMNLRAKIDCLMTSGKTVRDDNPALTVRLENGDLAERQPEVAILTRQTHFAVKGKLSEHPSMVSVYDWKSFSQGLQQFFSQKKYMSTLLEAGPRLSRDFLIEGCVDEVWRYVHKDPLPGAIENLLPLLQRNLTLNQTIVIDDQNSLEIWTHKERDEKNYFARL